MFLNSKNEFKLRNIFKNSGIVTVNMESGSELFNTLLTHLLEISYWKNWDIRTSFSRLELSWNGFGIRITTAIWENWKLEIFKDSDNLQQ